MKKLFLFLAIISSVLAVSVTAFAQCDRVVQGAIRCGYYDEGYQDGVSDAQNNRENDPRRYKDKLDSKRYESVYREGYNAGYTSIRPFTRWDVDQRSAYDYGYRVGEDDRRRNISKLPGRYEGQYNKPLETYYTQGYNDGYDNRPRNYDFQVPGSGDGTFYPPTNPPVNPPQNARGTEIGQLFWSGRVDNRVQIVVKGGNVTTTDLTNSGFQQGAQNLNGVLPRRPATINARLTSGRGGVTVVQQPSRQNDWAAILEVFDPKGGADDYRLEMNWSSPFVEEPYSAGRVVWKGRVDITGNIVIQGSTVQVATVSGQNVYGTHNISGYLAQRNGNMVRASRKDGRGTVNVIQQPSAENDFVAIVQINDTDRGDDKYEVEIVW